MPILRCYQFNSGLILPNLAADWSDILSWGNLATLAKITATTLAPGYSNMINMASMTLGLYSSAHGLYDLTTHFSWNGRAHERMAQICQLKGIVLGAWNAFHVGHAIPGEWSNLGSDLNQVGARLFDINTHNFITTASRVGFRAAGACLGNYSDSSLLEINLGASLAPTTFKKNLFTINVGAEASLFSSNIESPFLYNGGWLGGNQLTVLTDYTYNAGDLKGIDQFVFKAEGMHNSGEVDGNNVNVTIHHLNQQGHLGLHHGQAKIAEFVDDEKANSKLIDVSVAGSSLDSIGQLRAEHSHFDYANRFQISESSTANLEHVTIGAHEFIHGGQLDHQNGLIIEADKAIFKKGSVVAGKKTVEDALFVPKVKGGADKIGKEPSEKSATVTAEKGEENEFKPQHLFILMANEHQLQGKMTGGDYTAITGKPAKDDAKDATPRVEKCQSLDIDKLAEIDLTQGTIASRSSHISGHVHLNDFSVALGRTQIDSGGELALAKSIYKGEKLSTDHGTFKIDESTVTLDQTHFSSASQELFKDSTFTSTQFIDDSRLAYQGRVDIFTDRYLHQGRITRSLPVANGRQNLFYLKAKTANLAGSSDMDNAIFSVDHFDDASYFVSGIGQDANHSVNNQLMLETQGCVSLANPIYRDSDLTVKAAGIVMTADYYGAKDLNLQSTAGDVLLLSNLVNNNLRVKSAGSIWNNHSIYTNGLAQFEAGGGFYNLGGIVNANTVAVKAGEIKNVSAASYVATLPWVVAMGDAGIVDGRNDAYLEATYGNIENYGGVLTAGNYNQLIAKGNVLNACNIGYHFGAHDLIYDFTGGLIAGGSGVGTNGVGLYVRSDGTIISDASDFVSHGINYLEGDQGFILVHGNTPIFLIDGRCTRGMG